MRISERANVMDGLRWVNISRGDTDDMKSEDTVTGRFAKSCFEKYVSYITACQFRWEVGEGRGGSVLVKQTSMMLTNQGPKSGQPWFRILSQRILI